MDAENWELPADADNSSEGTNGEGATATIEFAASQPTITVAERMAIADAYFELPERLDLRALWRSGTVLFLRANWWTDHADSGVSELRRSEFVRLERVSDGWIVQELQTRKAA